MNEREHFEHYMRCQNPCVRLARQSESVGGAYRTITVERAWKAWHSAWATATYIAKRPISDEMVALPVIDPKMLEVGK